MFKEITIIYTIYTAITKIMTQKQNKFRAILQKSVAEVKAF